MRMMVVMMPGVGGGGAGRQQRDGEGRDQNSSHE